MLLRCRRCARPVLLFVLLLVLLRRHCRRNSVVLVLLFVLLPLTLVLLPATLPGALTLVLPRSQAVLDIVTAGGDTVAVRVPAHPLALALINELGMPVVGTSANLSGQPSTRTAAEVKAQFGEKLEMVIDGGRAPGGRESTIIDLTGPVPVIRRAGAISPDEIRQTIGEVIIPDGVDIK